MCADGTATVLPVHDYGAVSILHILYEELLVLDSLGYHVISIAFGHS